MKDFEPLSIIGRGAFGEVRICRVKHTGEVVAMKKMKKQENDKGKKAARKEFLSAYRQYVPSIVSKLPEITINDWKDAIDEVDNDVSLGASIKQLLISGVSLTKYCDCFYFLLVET